jgi:4-carboxymuconolactone decarboxylase
MSGRLPAVTPADLDGAQRDLYDSLLANEIPLFDKAGVEVVAADGGLLGPFNPLLLNPVLGAAQLDVFRADKTSSSLSRRVHEIVILTVGAVWGSEYELYAHGIVGRLAGLPADVIQALVSGRRPELEDVQEASAYEFARQLVHEHRIDSETYARAAEAFGPKGLADIVMLIGLYLTTCAIINAFEVPAPQTEVSVGDAAVHAQ